VIPPETGEYCRCV